MSRRLNVNRPAKRRKAWAIIDRLGRLALDKIMASPAEAWGLLGDEMSMEIPDLKLNGYRCVRVEIIPVR